MKLDEDSGRSRLSGGLPVAGSLLAMIGMAAVVLATGAMAMMIMM